MPGVRGPQYPFPVRPAPLQIGSVSLDTNLLLAPIAGYCDLAYRLTCREQGGVGLACTDLLSPHGLLRGTARSLDLAQTVPEDTPVGMQLYGSDPQIMAEGALWAVEHGADVVDINMGCPVDKVTKKDGGSRLMVPDEGIDDTPCRTFSLALRIVERVREVLPASIPLTCKMRLGWAHPHDAPRLACDLVRAGVCAITVHGRTTVQRFKGEADPWAIRRVVEAVAECGTHAVPVIANGDVKDPHACARMLEITRAAGVMIGRAAIDRPWIFRDCWHYLTTGELLDPPTPVEIAGIIERYFERMVRYRGERHAMVQIRQRIGRMTKAMVSRELPSVKPLREAVRSARTPEDVRAVLRSFCEGRLMPLPQVVLGQV